MTTTTKTYGIALEEIRNAVIEFELNGDVEATLKTSVAHSLFDVQMRDFTMGLTFEGHSKELILSFLDCVLAVADEASLPSINSVRASYIYRLGDTDKAYQALSDAKEIEPNYSLAILLTRVFGSGWSSSAFDLMVAELHEKVVAGILENSQNALGQFDKA